MNRCLNCGSTNNNDCYCKRCGRDIEKAAAVSSLKENKLSINFLNEVINTIEKVFPDQPVTGRDNASVKAINMETFLTNENEFVIDSERWTGVVPSKIFAMFFIEILIILLFSSVSSLLIYKFLDLSIILSVKTYFVIYFITSFLSWVLFPFVTESSPLSSSFTEMILIKGAVKRVKNDFATFFLLWILSFLYSFFPLLFLEGAIFLLFGRNFSPLMFQLAGIKYLQRELDEENDNSL